MIIKIYSPAGHGKTYLAVKKALELSQGKKLKSISWDMRNCDILKRVTACLEYYKLTEPTELVAQTKDLTQDLNELDTFLRKELEQYDVLLLDALMIRPDINDTLQLLRDISKDLPNKILILTLNCRRPSENYKVFDEFLNLEINDNEENFLVIKETHGFIVYNQRQKTEVFSSDSFLFKNSIKQSS